MRRTAVIALILAMSIACNNQTETPAPSEPSPSPTHSPQPLDNKLTLGFLPAYQTEAEKREPGGKTDAIDDFKAENKEWYKITEPPSTAVRFPGEFEKMGHLMVGWKDGTLDKFFTDIVKGAWGETTIILIDHQDTGQYNYDIKAAMRNKLVAAGIPSNEVNDPAKLIFIKAQLDSIWARDYGPQVVIHTDSENLSVIDTKYYHGRYIDDIIPTYLADTFGINVFRASINQEGGNFLSNGTGHCFTTRGSIWNNLPDPDEAQHKKLYKDYFGCQNLHFVYPLEGEGTTHIDMFMMVIGPKDIVVGEYNSNDDCINQELLEENVKILQAIKDLNGNPQFTIHRIPMPPNSDGIWRTYTNMQMVRNPTDDSRGTVLVPVYAGFGSYETEMLTKLAAAFKSAYGNSVSWTLKPINSDAIIPGNGAIHCVVKEIPAGIQIKQESEPLGKCENTTTPHSCQSTGCGTVTRSGYCDGNNAVYCSSGGVVVYDPCAVPCSAKWGDSWPCEQNCGTVQVTGVGDASRCTTAYICGSGCTNACLAGETGCTTEGLPYSCEKDQSGCLVRKTLAACISGNVCVNGSCVAENNCQGIDFVGKCEGNTVLYCEDNTLKQINCDNNNRICGYDAENSFYNCLVGNTCTDECSPDQIGCDGNSKWVCESSRSSNCYVKVKTDCGNGTCRNGICCNDECAPAETGCSLDKSKSWVCDVDVNGCNVKKLTECGNNASCTNAKCEAGCVDDCSGNEKGCTTDGKTRWICNDGPTGCKIKTPTACPEFTKCVGGECVSDCKNDCTEGQKGCEDDDSGSWVCVKDQGSGCLVKQVTLCPPGQSCRAGICEGQTHTCSNECQLGSSGCFENGSAAWVCQTQPNSLCTIKVTIPCASGQVCIGGSCQDQTVNPQPDTTIGGADTSNVNPPGPDTNGGGTNTPLAGGNCSVQSTGANGSGGLLLLLCLMLLAVFRRRFQG